MSNEPKLIQGVQLQGAQLQGGLVERTYEQAPTVIRHDEKTIYESHTIPTQVENIVLPVKVETHIAQPIIKEHHKDIIHEHHQNVIHEHHKNIIHEQH